MTEKTRIQVVIGALSAALAGVVLGLGGCDYSPQTSSGHVPGYETPPELVEIDQTPTAYDQIKGLWITRWDYRTRADVAEAMTRAADLGVTDVFWQVRGQADAFYRSSLEPWGEELVDAAGGEPTFDPLAEAVHQAHTRGLRLHAWINVMPLWKGATPPRDSRHLFHARGDWRLSDAQGRPQPLNDHYVIVNPTRDDVQDHIVAVSKDILSRYAVDGLHLDYIRFVSETMDQSLLYPGDAQSIRSYERHMGRLFRTSEADREYYRDWKRGRITDLVWRLKGEAMIVRPGAVLSAAVWRNPKIGYDQYLQDGSRWLDERLVDFVVPMIYTDDDNLFTNDLEAWRRAGGTGRVVAGVGIYKHPDPADSLAQFAMVGEHGICLFAYASLFESADPNQDKSPEQVAERARRLAAIRHGLKSQSAMFSAAGDDGP